MLCHGRSLDEARDASRGRFAVNVRAASYYAIGAKVWYRRPDPAGAPLRGTVAGITLGPPPMTYYVRLESKECVWAAFAELLPR